MATPLHVGGPKSTDLVIHSQAQESAARFDTRFQSASTQRSVA